MLELNPARLVTISFCCGEQHVVGPGRLHVQHKLNSVWTFNVLRSTVKVLDCITVGFEKSESWHMIWVLGFVTSMTGGADAPAVR